MCLTIRCRIQLLPVSSIVFQIRMPRTLSKKIRLGGNFQGTKNEFIVEEALYDAIWIANSRRRISRIVSFFLAANRTAVVSIGDTMSFVERERERERERESLESLNSKLGKLPIRGFLSRVISLSRYDSVDENDGRRLTATSPLGRNRRTIETIGNRIYEALSLIPESLLLSNFFSPLN